MITINGDGTLHNNIELSPATVHEEVIQNIAVLLDLVQKSCPMFRVGGISGELYGRPINVVKNLLVAQIYDQIQTYEPRAIINSVRFEENHLTGLLIPIVELKGVKEDG